jgi:hypothetical protein
MNATAIYNTVCFIISCFKGCCEMKFERKLISKLWDFLDLTTFHLLLIWGSTNPFLESNKSVNIDSLSQDPDSTVSRNVVCGSLSARTVIFLWYDFTDPLQVSRHLATCIFQVTGWFKHHFKKKLTLDLLMVYQKFYCL